MCPSFLVTHTSIAPIGHMVPMDVPDVAFEMIRIFMKGESFNQYQQKLDLSKEPDSCPVCPTCYERDSGVTLPASTMTETRADKRQGSPKFVWLFAGLSIGSFLTAIVFRRRTRREGGTDYDLELREFDLDPDVGINGSYEDEPNGYEYASKNRVV